MPVYNAALVDRLSTPPPQKWHHLLNHPYLNTKRTAQKIWSIGDKSFTFLFSVVVGSLTPFISKCGQIVKLKSISRWVWEKCYQNNILSFLASTSVYKDKHMQFGIIQATIMPSLGSHQTSNAWCLTVGMCHLTKRISCYCFFSFSGIVLSWTMETNLLEHATVAKYQIFACQESPGQETEPVWKKVGDVNALPLPMACTLSQFTKGRKYHFVIRAEDVHSRRGRFCGIETVIMVWNNNQ